MPASPVPPILPTFARAGIVGAGTADAAHVLVSTSALNAVACAAPSSLETLEVVLKQCEEAIQYFEAVKQKLSDENWKTSDEAFQILQEACSWAKIKSEKADSVLKIIQMKTEADLVTCQRSIAIVQEFYNSSKDREVLATWVKIIKTNDDIIEKTEKMNFALEDASKKLGETDRALRAYQALREQSIYFPFDKIQDCVASFTRAQEACTALEREVNARKESVAGLKIYQWVKGEALGRTATIFVLAEKNGKKYRSIFRVEGQQLIEALEKGAKAQEKPLKP